MEKYEITKEQILELENGFTLPKLKEWFPDAFKTELEAGKWYKENKENNFMFCFQGIYSRYESSKAYGFTLSGKWYENLGVDKESTYFESTEQEVKTALVNEANKKYKKGDYINGLYSKKIKCLTFQSTGSGQGNVYVDGYNCVWINVGDGRNEKVFENGKWAEIIPTLTKKEAEEKLGVKII